ncbi:MAG: TatD family hydrolase [Sulfurimonas sp.]|uniref:TatD family hydrolase n=1 Tax=Sulfurimonas sp. TaxID=2022749 RepID=UPI00262B9510|nr:TatD family hydrolase [Sulfurimonas sp.]MCW8895144.1 TatD family hydrolase [Sulfurimonas sp.]MCW8954046.1 TatD family hydrolase [Sulfurimonas sp.]MCW9068288.1 TatD family hydrolase [Sulfurimonas sp.]
MIVDTHVHLDDERYRDDLNEVLNRARKAGVERFIIPGADAKTIDRAVEISEENDDVYFAVGIHPYDMDGFGALDFDMYAKHKKCVAIGECGLDYYRLEGTDEEKDAQKARQKEVFIAQIELAKKYKKPLIVHIRNASRDSKQVLLDNNAKEVGGVLHCYNADEELLSLANENFYFGIGGVLTFKNARKLVNVLPKIPQDKLLIETDGPYLTPMPHRGERNEPLYTTFVTQKISELLEIPLDNIDQITTNNALKLFNIS